jgi:hypothetical protein
MRQIRRANAGASQGRGTFNPISHQRTCILISNQIHPLHAASLHFYTALSHDTLAREAALKIRLRSLALAEKHYLCALSTLSPPRFSSHAPCSPTSSTSSHDTDSVLWKFSPRPGSTTSFRSTASSSTSWYSDDADDDDADVDFSHAGFKFPQPPRTHSPALFPSRPTSPEEFQFAADTAAFAKMLRGHLANVRSLREKTSVPVVRFAARPCSDVLMRSSAQLALECEEVMERVRRGRRERVWRARFDPRDVQRLCGEAMAELC